MGFNKESLLAQHLNVEHWDGGEGCRRQEKQHSNSQGKMIQMWGQSVWYTHFCKDYQVLIVKVGFKWNEVALVVTEQQAVYESTLNKALKGVINHYTTPMNPFTEPQEAHLPLMPVRHQLPRKPVSASQGAPHGWHNLVIPTGVASK